VWTPSEGELVLFCIYSPIHAVLVEVVEHGELDHDGSHQLSGTHPDDFL